MQEASHMAAGAIVLMVMLGTIAFAASKLLYGEPTLGRITIGVVLPQEDRVAKQLVRMLGSLDSVKSSVISPTWTSVRRKTAEGGGTVRGNDRSGGMVQGFMDGTNTPVTITLPRDNALESRVFKELTEAGPGRWEARRPGSMRGPAA